MSVAVQIVILFVVNLALQVFTLILLPMTQGFTRPIPAIVLIVAMSGSMWCMARMIASGVGLGILFPIIAAAVPLAAIAVGTLLLGEVASVPKIALLVTACTLICFASRF
jgi:multidrug transporter EmrE-like cation transporter